MKTKYLNLLLLQQNQAAKEVIVNENFIMLDSLSNKAARDLVDSLPDEALDGSIYILSNAAERKNNVAIKLKDRWQFIEASEGMIFYIIGEKSFFIFNQGSWIKA